MADGSAAIVKAQADVTARLQEAAQLCSDLEMSGYQCTVRLVPAGYQVAVAYGFRTERRTATWVDITRRPDNVLLALITNCREHLPRIS